VTNIIRLVPEGASYTVDYRWTTYRFLLSNGNTIDVSAVQDDSWLRQEVLKIANGKTKATDSTKFEVTICGVARVP
jgi:hypothetical protein